MVSVALSTMLTALVAPAHVLVVSTLVLVLASTSALYGFSAFWLVIVLLVPLVLVLPVLGKKGTSSSYNC